MADSRPAGHEAANLSLEDAIREDDGRIVDVEEPCQQVVRLAPWRLQSAPKRCLTHCALSSARFGSPKMPVWPRWHSNRDLRGLSGRRLFQLASSPSRWLTLRDAADPWQLGMGSESRLARLPVVQLHSLPPLIAARTDMPALCGLMLEQQRLTLLLDGQRLSPSGLQP